MPEHEVNGAVLNYETFGTGPLLLMIPGADGRGAVFHDTAKHLAQHFKVVCWDRRGYSQSRLIGAQDFPNRLNVDADDANSLIELLSTSPAFVFGNSSGAIVATKLLIRHPKSIAAVVSHEPPAFALLPEEHRLQAAGLVNHIYNLYRVQGVNAAMEVFSGGLSAGDDGAKMRYCMDVTRGDEIRANALFWFEFELRQYTSAVLEMDAVVVEKEKYIPAAGATSGNGPGVGPIALIAHAVGKEVVRLPGGHISFMIDPKSFADALLSVFQVSASF